MAKSNSNQPPSDQVAAPQPPAVETQSDGAAPSAPAEQQTEQPPAVDVAELVARQQEMEAQLAALQNQIAAAAGVQVEDKPVQLHGPANPRVETEHRAAFWPHDAERQLAAIKTRTYRVTPVGGAATAGWPVAVVDRCYDANDAKAAYLRNKKNELHGLPLKIELVSEETYQPEGQAA